MATRCTLCPWVGLWAMVLGGCSERQGLGLCGNSSTFCVGMDMLGSLLPGWDGGGGGQRQGMGSVGRRTHLVRRSLVFSVLSR